MNFWTETFERPAILFLVIIPILYLYWVWKLLPKMVPSVAASSVNTINRKRSWRSKLSLLPELLLSMTLMALVLAAAGPRKLWSKQVEEGKGIDILLAIDVSNSMLTQDFDPNRMQVCKKLASAFVEKRLSDRIGLVVFGGASFTQCPLTIDHEVLVDMISQLEAGMLGDGTAVGMGLATAVNRLKESKAKSRIVILLTDGANNTGTIAPADAASLAAEMGVKVYAIGMGNTGFALAPVQKDMNGELVFGYRQSDLDEAQLRSLADQTGGMYFRAKTIEELDQVYKQIDYLEKSNYEAEITKKYQPMFKFAALAALGILLFSIGYKYWGLKRWL